MISAILFLFYGVCWHGIKSLQHVEELWEGGGMREKSTFWELIWKDVLAMNKLKLSHFLFID
jgi:hypothetical protein